VANSPREESSGADVARIEDPVVIKNILTPLEKKELTQSSLLG